jgi:hypothetical protein
MVHRLVVGAALCLLSVLPLASQAQTIAFVNAQGAPAATLLDGSAVRVRVVDAAANVYPVRDTVTATVTSDLAGDSESLSLLETGPGTGVFEGLIDLDPDGIPAGPTLATTTSPGPPATRDTVHAAYGSATASAGLVGSILRFIDDWGRESASFAAGHSVGLRVFDELRNDPWIQDLLTVTLSSQSGGDSEPFALQETGRNTGVFEGVFATTRTSSGHGLLTVSVPDTVTATLPAGDGVTSASAQIQAAGGQIVLRDAEGNLAGTFVESALVRIRVIDPTLPGTVSVQVTAAQSGDSETVTLQGGYVYDGQIQTVLAVGVPAIPGDGILQIEQVWGPPSLPDTMTVTYSGGGSPTSVSAGFIPGRLAFLDSRGEVTSSYAAGTEARIRLEQANNNTPSLDQTTARLVNVITGEEEYVTLTETRRDSNVFVGSVPLAVNGGSQWSDGVLNAQPGERIRVVNPYLVEPVAEISDVSLELLDEWGEPTDEIVESGTARVRMWSTSANSNAYGPDTATIEMRVLRNDDQEPLALTETGASTNVFEGSIPLEMGTYGSSYDGKLQTANTGPPDYRQDEVAARSGPVEITARTIGARIDFLDAFGRRTASYAAGDTVRLRIVDPFRSAYGSFFQVTLVSLSTNDSETVAMQETSPGSKVFTGSLPTHLFGSPGTNGTLLVAPGLFSQIEVRHATSFSPIELIERASILGSSVLFVDAAGQPAEVYAESTRAYVRVASASNNSSPYTPETVTVSLLAEISQDSEILTLTETGPDTGVFQGSIQMRLELSIPPSPGNGILETTEAGGGGTSAPHEFDTLRATFTGAPGEPAVDRIGLTGSRTWFGNEAGDEVLSYPVGGTAWVWVEDQNRNTPGQWDEVQAEVRAYPSAESTSYTDFELVTLQETTRDSGIFRVAVPLPKDFSPSNDGRVNVTAGGQIEATHQDYYGATFSTAVADIVDGTIEFVDEAGEPTLELVENDRGRVRLFSVNSNTSSGSADTVTVQVETQQAGDQEPVTLTETGLDTSVFEGSFEMEVGPGYDGNGTVETQSSGFPFHRMDQVTARYGPRQVTAQVVGARVRFFDSYGRETASFVAGEPVRVRVVDHNRNTPQNRDTVNVTLSSRDGGDSEPLVLQETGFNTAVFEGSLASVFGGGGGPSDGRLRVYPNDQAEAQYQTAFEPNPIVARAAVTGSSVLFIDAAGQPAAVYLESSRAWVRVVSSYANMAPFGSPYNVDTVSVQILSELSPDQEVLSLTETGPDTGVFEGSIAMRLVSGGVQPGNGLLETVESGHPLYDPPHEFDTLRATFSDATGTSEARIGLTGSRTWFADASGQEVLSYAVGGTAYIRVEDQNWNDPGQWNRVSVQVRSLSTGDQEFLDLLETSRDSGVFVKAIELTRDAPAPSDGKLSVSPSSPGEQIEALHQDYSGATFSSAVADIADAAIEILDEAGEPTVELLQGGDARVRLVSVYGNTSSGTVDTVTIQVRTLLSGDQEFVTLTETGPDTGVFEGSIQMAIGPASSGDGVLETAANNGFPEYRPEEVTARYGPELQATARVLGARVTFFDGYGREAASFAAGEAVRVRVVDHNRNAPQNRDTVNVTLSSRDAVDSEPLTLQETGFDTAVFEGSVPSVFGGAGSSSDGQLRVYSDDEIEAQYVPAFEPNPIVAHAAATGNAVLFLDAAGQPATVYLESSRAYVRVVSSNANYDPGSVNTVSVQVMSELSPDLETLSLTETGPSTSVFEGSIAMRLTSGGVQQGNGLLETVEAGHPQFQPPHEFDTLRATYSDPAGTSQARIGLTGSRTWFADAAGQEVQSYAVGGTAYIRVEDQNWNDPGQWNRVSVQVRSLSTGDQEFLNLLETSRDSGVFVLAVELTRDAPLGSDGKLSVSPSSPGEQIEAIHQDYQGATYSSAVAGITDAAIEILDEAGEPTAVLLQGGEAGVRLFSVYSNTSPSTVDTTTIVVQAAYSADQEFLMLTETGPDTGVFEGSIPMAIGPGNNGNGVLETAANDGFPEYRPEEVTARYGPDLKATARVLGARVTFFDGYGRETSSFAAGESVRVRVVDHNRNAPQNRDTVSLTLFSLGAGDSEPLTVQETGFDTAVFEGSVPSTFNGTVNPSDGRLQVFAADEIEAQYVPAFEPNPIIARAASTGSSVLFIDAAGQPATVYLESSRAYVRVVSLNANAYPESADTISVQIQSELSPDLETMTLTETGPNTGVFDGSIQMRLSSGGVQQGNGLLETVESGHPQFQPPHEFDTLRATYSNPAGTSEARIGLTGSRTWFADAAGQEVLSYAVGGMAWIRVEDQNWNDPGQWNRVSVQLRSLSTGDQELLDLLETSRTSGVFVKAVELTRGAPLASDGKLSVSPGDQIEAIHHDYQGATYSSAVADIADGAIEIIDEAGEPTEELLQGGDAGVRLFSVYSNTSPGTVDTTTILVQASYSADQEFLTLTETGPDTGVFEGSIPMALGPASNGNGVLETAANGGFPEYRPDEVTARYGPGPELQATARVLGARVTFFDGYGRETTSFAAGESVRVRVVDHNRNAPQNRDTVNVTLSSLGAGDNEPVTLQETGFDTAVFEGSVPSALGSGGPSDGLLRVYPDDEIEARYVPAFEPNPIIARAASTGSSVLFIDAAGQPAAVYLESSRAYVRVVSLNANSSPSSADTVSVQIQSELSPDLETMTLTETGPNTGVFDGSIQMRLSSGGVQQGNGLLETVESGHPQFQPPHEFDTLRAIYSNAAGTSEARIGLTGSRTWFADAAGQEVLSYAVGGTAWIRVEDQNWNDPGQWNRVSVQLRSLSTGDQELLELLETSRESGVFVKAIELTRDAPVGSDGKLAVSPGDQIEATHQDYPGATYSSTVADIASEALEIIDEAGEPTVELLQGGDIRVRLFSVYNNSSPGVIDTTTIPVQASYSADQEFLTLTETGPDTSVFEGSIPMAIGPASNGNGVLETAANSGFPEYRPEEVTASYGPGQEVRATARVLGARVTFFDGYGRETASFAAGESVRVRVVDHNRNAPQSRDTVSLTLSSLGAGDSEPLTVQETGFDTAIFEGSVPSTFNGTVNPADGRLQVFALDEIEARYVPAFEPNPIVARAASTGNAVLFIDAAGQPATVYLESSRAYVRVVSLNANSSPSSADTVSVQIMSELSPDLETLILTETGPNTGVFDGSIQMRLSSGGVQQGNGLLETVESGHPQFQPPHEFDTLRATYSNAAGTSEARIGLTGSRTWFADAAGQEVLSYAVGGTAWIRVEDQNWNDPGQWNQVSVQVRSLSTGDQEFLDLLETSRDSGVFVLAIGLTRDAPVSSDGKLSVSPGGQIEATHQGYQGATYSSAVADIADAALEIIDEAGEPTAELLQGGDVRVRLFSVYNNSSPGTIDTATIPVRASYSADQEFLMLIETGPDTSVFEGSIPMAIGPAANGNGVLDTAANGGFPEYRPEEVTASYGPGQEVQAMARVLGARVTFFDGYGRETASFAAGESVRVRVVDHNRNAPQSRDTVSLTLFSLGAGDSEPLTVQETGFDTAVFEGSVPSTFNSAVTHSDGELQVFAPDEIEARYVPAFEPNPILARAASTGNAVLFIDAAGQPPTVYLESSRAYVRVVSLNANFNPASVDTVSVQLLTELTPDVETLSLTETGPSTGVFEGSIPMRLTTSGVQQGNGLLETAESGHPVSQPPHEFDTLLAAYSDPAGTSMAQIGLTGSRTWFADAAGREVSAYAVGATAWVRVEDQNWNDPGQLDMVSVQVTSPTGDQEFLTLQETALGSGIFAGSLPLVLNSPQGDGQLKVAPGSQIQAVHQDYLGATSSTAAAGINEAALEFIDEAGQPAAELVEGGTARVRMLSLTGNSNPSAAETVTIQVQSQYAGDTEPLTLTETGPDTGLFEGAIPMQAGPGSPSNGVLQTSNSGSPEYRQDEVTASSGPISATATVVPARVAFINLRGQEVSSYSLRSTVGVRVTDHNRNTDPGQSETLQIGVQSLAANDTETLTLTETGPGTGVFEGSVPSTDAGPAGADGVLLAPPGPVEAAHLPAYSPSAIVRQATMLSTLAPVAADDTATTVEDTPVNIPVLANDSGTGSLTVSAVTQPAHGSAALNPDGTVTYTPAAGYSGPDAFTYLLVDAEGGEDVGDVTVTITPGNQAPTPAPDNFTTPEDQPLTVNVLANDTDPDQDPLDVVAITQPAAGGGTAVLNADNTVTYTPPANATPVAYINYTVRDPDGAEATTTLRIEVTAVNDPPVANDDTASTEEDTLVVIDVRANDSDIDSATYVPVSVTTPASGTAEIILGDIVYTPNPGFSGTDTFSYTLQDDAGATDTAAVTVTVNGVNDSPAANDDTATTDEDSSVSIAVLDNDSDPETDPLQMVSTTQGTNGSVAINPDQTVSYTPAANFHGTDSFTCTISDGNGGTATATVTVTITPVNDTPVANDDTALVAEDGTVAVPVLANDDDADDDTLTVASVTQGAHGAVVINANQTVTYTPVANYNGTDTFTYTVSDGNGGSATATVTVTIGADNDAPVAGADSATTPEDTAVTVTVLANDTDADNDALDVVSVTQGTNGTVTLNADETITYTPALSFYGTDTFTYTVGDGNGGSATATVTITITSVNDAPVANADTALVAEDGSVAVTVLANDDDADNDTLTVTSVTQGAHGAVVIDANQTVSYSPAANYNGTDTFTYTVSDGNGGTATATVTVTIGSDNDAPVAGADSATTPEDTAVTVTVLANDSDLDNDPLDVVSVTQGAHGAVTINANETVTYTPALSFHGTDTFTYTVGDGNGGSATATVTITVTSVNDAPVANDDPALVAEDGTVAVPVLANDDDADDDTLTVASVTQGAHGAVAINPDQTVSYTPAANYNGTDTFTYTVSDGNGGTATATVTVTIGSDNDAPVAGADSATTPEDTAVTVTVLANDSDADNDTLDVVSVTQGTNGTVTLNADETVTYTPALNFHGTDTFTYTVNDGNGGSATATVTITVTSVNDAPVANADTALVAEDSSVAVTVLANDDDADNDTLTVASVTQGAHGAVVINANQTVTYTPAANYNGGDSFTCTVSDGNGSTATATVTVTVSSVNDAPTANTDTSATVEDAPVAIAVLGNDTDPENNPLTVQAVTPGANGTVTINANQTVTYTPNANFHGSDAFTYTIGDGNGGTSTAAVTVTISPVNDAPVAVNDTASTTAEVLVNIPVLSNDVDVDGPSLSVSGVTQPAHGTVTVNANQTLRYTPASAYVGADSFTYTVTDGAGGTATATVNVTVNAPPRVTTNLQTLYGFNEGSGTAVTDTSGVGTPLNLTIGSAAAVTWIPGGLRVNSATLIQSAGAATKVITASQSTNAITLEAWVDAANLSQTGPAPIVTVSQQSNKRNFTLGQSGNRWDGRLRTSTTNQAGNSLQSAAGTATLNLTHVVYTRDAAGSVRIYVNGVQSASTTLTGNFSAWTSNYKLGLVNELSSGTPWRGELYLVAIYNRALSAGEVRQNWLAGE